MPRNRFQEILRFWHANNNEEEPPKDSPDRDRLYKLRPVITHLQDRFQNVYTPEKEIAIDEIPASVERATDFQAAYSLEVSTIRNKTVQCV